MEARIQFLLAEARCRDASRPVLRGEAIPGNAWDDYDLALKEARKSLNAPGIGALLDFWNRKPGADRPRVEFLLEQHGNAIEHLREGTRRSMARARRFWEGEDTAAQAQQMDVGAATFLILGYARILSEEGDPHEAMELLLDLTIFGRDVWENGVAMDEMNGAEVIRGAMQGLGDLVRSGRLDAANLVQLDQELLLVERVIPDPAAVLKNDALRLGKLLLREEQQGRELWNFSDQDRKRSDWRWAYSTRLKAADAFFHADRWTSQLGALLGRPWNEALPLEDIIREEAQRWRDPVVPHLLSLWVRSTRMRSLLAQMRAIRTAAHYLATGEVLELDDPFGGKLCHSIVEGKLKVWSVEGAGMPLRKEETSIDVGPRK